MDQLSVDDTEVVVITCSHHLTRVGAHIMYTEEQNNLSDKA